MDAKLLMIGDWIKRKDDNKPCKVDSIINTDDCCLLYTAEDDLSFDYMFEPIPLTPEILEKNGFSLYGICENLGIQDFDADIESAYIDIKLQSGYSCISIEIYGMGDIEREEAELCSTIQIDNSLYVHQLQHALRLCGINKEIVL